MNKIEEYVNLGRLTDLLSKKEEKKKCNPWICALAIVGAVVTVCGIAYAVYRFLIPDYMEDYEDFEDDDSTCDCEE